MDHEKPCRASKARLDRTIGDLFLRQHGVIARQQALGVGFTPAAITGRLVNGEWVKVHRSVYRHASVPRSREQEVLAVCLARGPGTVASHRSAAFLLDMDAVTPSLPEVSATRGRSQLRGVIIHRVKPIPACDVSVVRSIPTTTASRTLVDLGAVVGEDGLELALESALRQGLTSIPRLKWRLDQLCGRGRPGCAQLRRLLAERGNAVATASPLETRLARVLRSSSLPPPVRQYQIKDGGHLVARVDFAYPYERVAVEADSFRWHTGRNDWERELRRRNDLQRLGWFLVHVTDGDLRRAPDEIVAKVSSALRSRGQASILP